MKLFVFKISFFTLKSKKNKKNEIFFAKSIDNSFQSAYNNSMFYFSELKG